MNLLLLSSLFLLFTNNVRPIVVMTNRSNYVAHDIVENDIPNGSANVLRSYTISYKADTLSYPLEDFEYDGEVRSLVNFSNNSEYYSRVYFYTRTDSVNDYCYSNVFVDVVSLREGYRSTIGGVDVNQYTNFSNVYVQITYSNVFEVNVSQIFSMNETKTYTLFDDSYPLDCADLSSRYFHYTDFITFTYFIENNDYEFYYDAGYQSGLNENSQWNLSNYLYSIIDIPILYLKSFFGFELFGGISLFAVITSLITIAIVIFVIRKFV